MKLPFDAETQRWIHSAARAVDWLEARLDDTGRLRGALHDLGSYYKWPLFLYALGRFALAEKVLDVIVEDFMTSDGDFRTGADKSADPLYDLIAGTYTNTWPIVAARALGRPDVARAALECLRRRRVPETGGFLTGRPGQHPDGRQDIVTIAGCGNAFLAWAKLEEAAAAGDCLLRVLDAQKGPANPFYLYIDRTGRLLRQVDVPERLYRIRLDRAGQVYVYLGMAAVFLARLSAVIGEERFLEGARGYLAVTRACGPAVYTGIGCCKTGWAAAAVYRLTGEEEYRRSAYRAATEILAAQGSEGGWAAAEGSAILCCDDTGEMGYHLTQYCLELSGFA
jgi:hypothetical protein